MRHLLLVIFLSVLFISCLRREAPECEVELFGRPVAATGLSVGRCNSDCECNGFKSRTFTPAEFNALKQWKLREDLPSLTTNPYEEPVPPSEPCLCAVIIEDVEEKIYRLETFPDEAAASAAGGIVTHYDACGLCSTLPDFAVYAEKIDVGAAVKQCGLRNFNQPLEQLVACIEDIGFTRPCAEIWAYNLRHTQANCLQECLGNDPYHKPDGSLSPCLQCDEDKSGPVFKAVAGRTRRNTGIATSICRPCSEVNPIGHNYPF
jgi:hypothetical protein